MSDVERINAILKRDAPAVWAALSPLGRRVAFPMGNPAQSADARGTELNATIGQVTDGRGQPLPLATMRERVPALDARKAFLYSPQPGHADLRAAWAERQRRLSGGSVAPTSTPLVTHGLTQGISLIADLFADPDTTVILPDLNWENYELLFQMRAGAAIRTYPMFRDGEYNAAGLEAALTETPGKKIVILGFPGNPVGYTPPLPLAQRIAMSIGAADGPLVVVADDAYAGLVYEDGLQERSIFWDVLEVRDPARHVVFKVDGATKELFFFPGRVGFLTSDLTGEAAVALESKLKCVGRGTVGAPPGPSQALVLAALNDPSLHEQIAAGVSEMKARYQAVKAALAALDTDLLVPYPFNSGLFALVRVHPSIDADALRLKLIREHGVGTIVLPEHNALRIAFCSVRAEDLPDVVERMLTAARAMRPARGT